MKRLFFTPLVIIGFGAILASALQPPRPAPAGGPIDPGDVAWMLTATSLVLLMTPGLAFFYGGMVSTKNVISTMLQCFVALGLVSVLWVVAGFSLAFGDSLGGVVGNPATFFMFDGVNGATHERLSPTIPLLLFALFQLKFAIITPALITGAFAERVRFVSYLVFMSLFSLLVYAPLAHWTWHPDGFLRQWGVLDFAGGTVVHMSAGLAALVGAAVFGRRQSHVAREPHQPAQIPYVLLGTGLLWFGWFGFNAGSALGASETAVRAFATTNTASAAAMMAWLFAESIRGTKPSATGACIGAVVGLVAVTPAAGYVTIPASIVIGVLAAAASNAAVHWRSRSTLDDTLDVFPCHGVGGMVGMLLTAVFAVDGGLITGEVRLVLVHAAALVLVTAYVVIASWVAFRFTAVLSPLRVDDAQEEVGLDLSQHGEQLMLPSITAP